MFLVGRESCFEAFFLLPRGWKCDFQRFFNFGRGRNAVFAVFRFSAMAEMLFLLFSTLRPRPKADFRCFFSFGRGGNTVFTVFYFVRRGGKSIFAVFSVSAAAEMLFSLFSTRPPWRKVDFQCFLTFIHGCRAFFASFSFSSTDDE